MLQTLPASPRIRRAAAIAGTVLLLGGVTAVVTGEIHADRAAADSAGPATTVRQFLIDAVTNENGRAACRYLTPSEQQSVAAQAGAAGRCWSPLDQASLTLGGTKLTTVVSIEHRLRATTYRENGVVHVRIGYGGGSDVFTLAPVTAAEREVFLAPATNWRISGGAAALLPR